MKLPVIVGPTASGKTDLAVRLCELLHGEVVSADSVQVYRGFDIGSGKPSADELQRAPHHLIGCADPMEPMDAARWAELAELQIAEIRARGRIPVICGGTFLYVKALIFGLAPAPQANEGIRSRHRDLVEQQGRAALHALLFQSDPESAMRLEPNDFVRVSRALEVHEQSGIPMSEWQRRHGFRAPRHECRLFGLSRSREDLDVRMQQRIDRMLELGWVDEVKSLVEAGFRDARAMAAVGYRQVLNAIDAGMDADFGTLSEEVYRSTRVFARRQRTWLRDQAVEWLEPNAELGSLSAWQEKLLVG